MEKAEEMLGEKSKSPIFRQKGKIDIVLSIFTIKMRMGVPIWQKYKVYPFELAKVLNGRKKKIFYFWQKMKKTYILDEESTRQKHFHKNWFHTGKSC